MAHILLSSLFKFYFCRLLRIEETGLQQRWYLRFYKVQVKCGASVSNFVQVGIRETYWAFNILVYGIAAAILLFVVEHALKNKIKLKKRI